jgi:hypothetical protein
VEAASAEAIRGARGGHGGSVLGVERSEGFLVFSLDLEGVLLLLFNLEGLKCKTKLYYPSDSFFGSEGVVFFS